MSDTAMKQATKGQFEANLAFGDIAQTDIAQWILRHDGMVLPVYDIQDDSGKGPRMFGAIRSLIVPDLLVVRKKRLTWIEAKHKSVFTWWRKTQRWTTGIDLHHYRQYLAVEEVSGVPVWLLFLHESSTPWKGDRPYSPSTCPVGLFGERLEVLRTKVDHEAPPKRSGNGHGSSGMMYWAHESLTRLATLDEILAARKSA
jgi:hypothetical protein